VLLTACGSAGIRPPQTAGERIEQLEVDGFLTFSGPDGQRLAAITIEIAETPRDQEIGLMGRQEMDPMHGMLFVFESVEPKGFWMHNTYIPLDIIFVNEDGRVVRIAGNTAPLSQHIHDSVEPVKYVVEVNAGFTRRFSIGRGTQIRWRRR